LGKISYKSLKVTEDVYQELLAWKELFEDESYSVTIRRLMRLSRNGGIQGVIQRKNEIRDEFNKTR
jgi:predicted CopG family antitoxin